MVITGVDNTIAGEQQRAIRLAEKVFIPNARYRTDIGSRLIARDFEQVAKLGLLAAERLEKGPPAGHCDRCA